MQLARTAASADGSLRWLRWIWAAFAGVILGVQWRRLEPAPPSEPRTLELAPAIDAGDGGAPPECGEDERYLQLAWIQISEDGLDEALLAATQVGLLRGQRARVPLKHGDVALGQVANVRWDARTEGLQRASEGEAASATSLGVVEGTYDLDLAWEGTADGVALLRLHDSVGELVVLSRQGSGGGGSDRLLASSLLLAEDETAVIPHLSSGGALFLHLTRHGTPTRELGRIETWRGRMRSVASRPRRASRELAESVLRSGDKVDTRWPVTAVDPLASAAVASLVLRDPELAREVRAAGPGQLELELRPHERGNPAIEDYETCVALLQGASAAGSAAGNYDFALRLRALLVASDPSAAAMLESELEPRLADGGKFLWISSYLEFEPPPAARAAWRRLRAAATSHLGFPWNLVLRHGSGVILLLLVPLALGALVASARRGRAALDASVRRATLTVLLVLHGLVLLGLGVHWAFALAFAGLCLRRLRRDGEIRFADRVWIAIACSGLFAAGLQDLRWMIGHPMLSALAELSLPLSWLLVGEWVGRDRSGVAPASLAPGVLALLAAALLQWTGTTAGRAPAIHLLHGVALLALAWLALRWPAAPGAGSAT